MSRLPLPGQDNGTWGDILNDFLLRSHSSDGSLKSTAISEAGFATTAYVDASITDAKSDAVSDSHIVRVVHGLNANKSRPDVAYVEWVGAVAPLNANTDNDTWIDTT